MSAQRNARHAVALLLICAGTASTALAQGAPAAPSAAPSGAPGAKAADKFPPFEQAIEGLEKVVSTADGAQPLCDLYRDAKTGKLLGVLPAGYESKLMMFACTVTGGDPQAGVMGPTHYARWERYDKQLALVAPDLSVRTNGDAEAKASVEQLYTGRVILSTPILAMAPGDRPVIDLGAIATRDAGRLFGSSVFGGYGPELGAVNAAILRLTKAKAFPHNVVFEYQAPRPDGQIVRFAVSMGELTGTAGFTPRKSDPKFGYFYDWHRDFAKTANREVTERYITRWSIEKRDPGLKLSPPKRPIVWHIEHTTPVRFRRYVREGILFWNEAFKEIGIDGALVVYQQDAQTGDHMDKDPEDARYNFFRWNASDQTYAIGPSRTNPQTGEILDADVVWHQGLTRSVRGMVENLSGALAAHAFGPETLAWLEEHPTWDPRVRLASPARRAELLKNGVGGAGGGAAGRSAWALAAMGGNGVSGGGGCSIGELMALDFSLADAAFAANLLVPGNEDLLEDLPEEFVGQMIRYISAHEVGHCLGLEHNMIASSIRTLKEINTPGFSGPTVGSVMDYAAANLNHKLGEVQGPFATPSVGPYDKWVIAYGYGPEDKLPELRKQAAEKDLIYQAQVAIGVSGDPRNNTWDLGADNLEFAESRLSLIGAVRAKLLDKVVKDGESWGVARRRYQSLLGVHTQMLSIASRWVGGSYLNNDAKGDPAARPPVQDIPAETQRRALKLVIDNAFEDGAFGLTPDLVRHLGKEHFYDPDAVNETMQDWSYTVHDSIGGVQATALTLVMNPTTLRRLYDNEFRANGENPITMAEVVKTVSDTIWREYSNPAGGGGGAGKATVSSLRRNLQREHAERLITLALLRDTGSAAMRAVSTLAMLEIGRIDDLAEKGLAGSPDAYTRAHLEDVRTRFARTREAAYSVTR
ncbi:MAG: zinc-dependent metalloprotease [Phycisphaerales bacterium]